MDLLVAESATLATTTIIQLLLIMLYMCAPLGQVRWTPSGLRVVGARLTTHVSMHAHSTTARGLGGAAVRRACW